MRPNSWSTSTVDTVEARIRLFDQAVSRGIENIAVVALAADHLIITALAVQHIVAGATEQAVIPIPAIKTVVACLAIQAVGSAIAVKAVGALVAESVDIEITLQKQVFEVCAQTVLHETVDPVDSRIGLFDKDIALRVDIVAVVTRTACHLVGAGLALEDVIAAATEHAVIARTAIQVRRPLHRPISQSSPA